ncbi:MAG: YihY/virulence factor BrkB family protein [Desulfobia sp.]
MLLRIFFIVFRESKRDGIALRARALTFTIVLSMVPMLALGTAVLKGLGAGDQMRKASYRLVDQLGQGEEDQTNPEGSEENRGATGESNDTSTESTMTMHLRSAIDQIFDYVDSTNFTTLGTFGMLALILAALSVMGSIEKSMNTIWQADAGRSWGRRIIDYLALLILLPISINLGLATEAALQSQSFFPALFQVIPVAWLGKLILKVLPVVVLIATFGLLYRFLPNTKVDFTPALVGGCFGGISWILVQIVYLKLQIAVSKYNAIYGSFATLPLLLLWLYIGLVVFLAGAELAFAVQVRRHYLWKDIELTPLTKLGLAFKIMEAALRDFRDRKVSTKAGIARKIQQPDYVVSAMINDLLRGNKLRLVEGEEPGYVPVAPGETIKADEFIDLFIGSEVPDTGRCPLASDFLTAAKKALSDRAITSGSSGSSYDQKQ